MKYRYFLSALQCNRLYNNFMRSCDCGISDVGTRVEISFITDKEPTKENIEKIEKLLESSKEEISLSSYYATVKFIRTEVVLGEE